MPNAEAIATWAFWLTILAMIVLKWLILKRVTNVGDAVIAHYGDLKERLEEIEKRIDYHWGEQGWTPPEDWVPDGSGYRDILDLEDDD